MYVLYKRVPLFNEWLVVNLDESHIEIIRIIWYFIFCVSVNECLFPFPSLSLVAWVATIVVSASSSTKLEWSLAIPSSSKKCDWPPWWSPTSSSLPDGRPPRGTSPGGPLSLLPWTLPAEVPNGPNLARHQPVVVFSQQDDDGRGLSDLSNQESSPLFVTIVKWSFIKFSHVPCDDVKWW